MLEDQGLLFVRAHDELVEAGLGDEREGLERGNGKQTSGDLVATTGGEPLCLLQTGEVAVRAPPRARARARATSDATNHGSPSQTRR